MPPIRVVLFKEKDGSAPLLEWLERLPDKVQIKCFVKLERLRELGHEMRRPEEDLLRNKIRELRVSYRRVHYRMLYFFHDGRAVISHGVVKENVVPPKEIDLAIDRMNRFRKNSNLHTYEE